MKPKPLPFKLWVWLFPALLTAPALLAQDAPTYQTPPKALADLVTVPPTPTISV